MARRQRLDIDEAAKLVSDARLLDEVVKPREETYGQPPSRSHSQTDGPEDDDAGYGVTAKQREVLVRVLAALREPDRSIYPTPTVTAAIVEAMKAAIARDRQMMATITDCLAELLQHPKFPRSTTRDFEWGIHLARDAIHDDAPWAAKEDQHRRDSWPGGYRAMLLQDWIRDNGHENDNSGLIPVADVRDIIHSIRIMQANADLVIRNVSAPLRIKGIHKPLAAQIDAVIDELKLIAGSTSPGQEPQPQSN
ncbi:hypothetical protein [Rhodoglobus aureus]|uniref:Uncharacterized protein n=1 Tax=Rhodoglobus aureus TaxID=191497 RepID=A0ABN1VK53_9MICO